MPKEPSLVLILKWGGELTPAGRVQAEELGRIFRCMYPGGQGRRFRHTAAGEPILAHVASLTLLILTNNPRETLDSLSHTHTGFAVDQSFFYFI